MKPTEFKDWLVDRIDELDQLHDHPSPDLEVAERCGTIASEAGDHAAKLGFPELYKRSCTFGYLADIQPVKAFLAECLGAIPQASKERAELLPVEDVATIINASPASIYRLADGGLMPKGLKVGKLVRWARVELDKWIATGCKKVK